MTRRNRFTWMVSPKSFISLLGAEYELMRQAGGTVLLRFYLASVTILAIAVISFLSVAYAIELLFHSVLVELFLSVFLSLLFLVMYIFLINTFTKQSFVKGDHTPETLKAKKHWNLSNLSRIGFVVFMGFILSKPVEIFCFRKLLEEDLIHYKEQMIQVHAAKVNTLFARDEKKLTGDKQRYAALDRDSLFKKDIERLTMALDSVGEKKMTLIATANDRIEKSSFFIFRVRQTTSNYWASWIICLLLIALYLLPGYLIYSISRDDEYFRMKSSKERAKVEKAFQAFAEKYAMTFREKFGHTTRYYSVYLDPPFNTVRKPDLQYKPSEDFFSKYAKKES